MKLDAQKYREALAIFGGELEFFHPPDQFHDWLNDKGLPNELTQFLIENAIRENLPFPGGGGGVWPPDDIMLLNDQESAILAAGLFALGNAINGDFIVLDLADGSDQAGFVSHDELWDNAPSNVREIFAPVADSIHEMLAGVAKELREWAEGTRTTPSYPIDYCSAI